MYGNKAYYFSRIRFSDPRNWVPLAFVLAALIGNLAGKILNEDDRYFRNTVWGLIGGLIGGAIWQSLAGTSVRGVFDSFLAIIIGGFLITLIEGIIEKIIKKRRKDKKQTFGGR